MQALLIKPYLDSMKLENIKPIFILLINILLITSLCPLITVTLISLTRKSSAQFVLICSYEVSITFDAALYLNMCYCCMIIFVNLSFILYNLLCLYAVLYFLVTYYVALYLYRYIP